MRLDKKNSFVINARHVEKKPLRFAEGRVADTAQDVLSASKVKKRRGAISALSDPIVKKTINLLMKNGKRGKAENNLLDILNYLNSYYPSKALIIFYKALLAVKRDIGIRMRPKPKKRRKRKVYDVYIPFIISFNYGLALGLRALIIAGKQRSASLPLYENIAKEILDAAVGKGDVVSKRFSLNSLAKRNKRRANVGSVSIVPMKDMIKSDLPEGYQKLL